jgi:selenobiotic family peptide radical SAM maturase
MKIQHSADTYEAFPVIAALLGDGAWEDLIQSLGNPPAASLPGLLLQHAGSNYNPGYLPELASLEWKLYGTTTSSQEVPLYSEAYALNPTLEVIRNNWRLARTINNAKADSIPAPAKREEMVLLYRHPGSGKAEIRAASAEDTIALKIVSEGLSIADLARDNGVPEYKIFSMVKWACLHGFITGPRTALVRNTSAFPAGVTVIPERVETNGFSLQWHITNACDLHCAHCYDRSDRTPVSMEDALRVLDDLGSFCMKNNVLGNVFLTGGNPLMHSEFFDIYREVVKRGFWVALMGNPTPRKTIQKICEIRRPGGYQMSLEGLPEYNDSIRGKGNFSRVMECLGVLRELGIQSKIMLTLHDGNIDQVIPLAERLSGHTDLFLFNRLSQVGEGAGLRMPSPEKYRAFMEEYIAAAQKHPFMKFKDNLLNIVLHEKGLPFSPGCAGFACAAAFSCLALLPDGEVHACRKYPTPLGNIFEHTIQELYYTEEADKYRRGSTACDGCSIRQHCSGCYAVIAGMGRDMFTDKDPFCFMEGR